MAAPWVYGPDQRAQTAQEIFLTPPVGPTGLRMYRPERGDEAFESAWPAANPLERVIQWLTNLQSGQPNINQMALIPKDRVAQQAVRFLEQRFPKVIEQVNRKLPDIDVMSSPTTKVSDVGFRSATPPVPQITIPSDPTKGGRVFPYDLEAGPRRVKGPVETPASGLLHRLIELLYWNRPAGPPPVTGRTPEGFGILNPLADVLVDYWPFARHYGQAVGQVTEKLRDVDTGFRARLPFMTPGSVYDQAVLTDYLSSALAERMLAKSARSRRPRD